MPSLILILFIQFVVATAIAQSARSVSTGNISAAITDERAVFHNPAGLAWNEGTYLSANVLNHHFLKELTTKNAAASITTDGMSFSTSFSGSGDERMKINQAAFSYAKKFGHTFSMSLSAHWLQLAFADVYGKKTTVYPSFGFLSRAGKSGMIGFYISNPGRNFIQKNQDERFRSRFSTCYRHDFSKVLQWHIEIEKSSLDDPSFKSGIIYKAMTYAELSMGLEFPFRRAGLGLSVSRGDVKIDLALSCQLETGFSTALGIIYKVDR